MKNKHFSFAFAILVIAVIVLGLLAVAGSPAVAAPKLATAPNAQKALSGPTSACPASASADSYTGVYVKIINDTIGATLLETTIPVNRTFQNRLAIFPSGFSTDNYTFEAYAYSNGDPTTARLRLVDTSGLSC